MRNVYLKVCITSTYIQVTASWTMAANDPPTTRDVTSAYLLHRLPTAENTIFNTNIRDLKKCILGKVIPQPVGKLGESAKKCAMFLDILRTEDDFRWTDLSMAKYANTSRLNTWKELRITALVHIFKNGHMSLDAIMQLLEFTISQLIEVLFQKNIPSACALFDWMVATMEKSPIGPAGETIDGWIAENGGWIKIAKYAVQCKSKASSESPSPRTIHCKNCQKSLTVTLGTIEVKCECTKWVCLLRSCGQFFESESRVRQHFVNSHAPYAELNECQHCGNAKDRSLDRCPICAVLWCVNGDCGFETHNSRTMVLHKVRCRRSIRQQGTANTAVQGDCHSNTPTDDQPTPTAPRLPTQVSPRTVKCEKCSRELLAKFGTIRELCTCGIWTCLVRGCTFCTDNSRSLSQHLFGRHFNSAKLDKCSHCGNYKDRNLTECPVCGALWCGVGDCPFETKDEKQLKAHKKTCGKSKKQPGAAKIVQQGSNKSNTPSDSSSTASQQSKHLIPRAIICRICSRQFLAQFGSVREQCTCGTWSCLVKDCRYCGDNLKSIQVHFRIKHIQNARLDECLHCGNYKDRSLTKCPSCGALWCVSGNCRYETTDRRAMGKHQIHCKSKHKKQDDDQSSAESDELLEE